MFTRNATPAIVLLLLLSLALLVTAPAFMPPDYSWLSHTTSQSAAQGLPHAWIARTGFLLYGLAVAGLSLTQARRWSRGTRMSHLVFGGCMMLAGMFSVRHWNPELPYDSFADGMHSWAATVMGFGFGFGVLGRFLHGRRSPGLRGLDVLAMLASVVLPLLMREVPELAGALQRLMFAVSYLWYGVEAWSLRRAPDR